MNEIFPDHMYAVDGDGIEIMTELFSLDWVLEEVVSVRDNLR